MFVYFIAMLLVDPWAWLAVSVDFLKFDLHVQQLVVIEYHVQIGVRACFKKTANQSSNAHPSVFRDATSRRKLGHVSSSGYKIWPKTLRGTCARPFVKTYSLGLAGSSMCHFCTPVQLNSAVRQVCSSGRQFRGPLWNWESCAEYTNWNWNILK